MITLPPGFDVSLLFGEYITLAIPFISITVAVVAYILISKAFKYGGK